MPQPQPSRRHTLRALSVGAVASWAWPLWAKDIWISGITRTRHIQFSTEALSNLPEAAVRKASPRMVEIYWTFDPASPPDAAELRRVQDRLLADAQALLKPPQRLHLVATGLATEKAFWCFYVPESFKMSDAVETLAGFDSPDQTMALRLRNRLSNLQRRDPGWTWIEAYLREMARK